MLAEDSELNACVSELRTCKKKLTPQFIVHCAVIVGVETTHGECQLAWEQNFRLNYVATRTPDGCYTDQILQTVNSAPTRQDPSAGFIYIRAVAHINSVPIKTDLSRMSGKSIPAQ